MSLRIRILQNTVFLMVLGVSSCVIEKDPVGSLVEIGRHKQLFVDDFVVGSTQGIRRVLNSLERYEGNPILEGDNPWERWIAYPNGRAVLYDNATGQFKMWYMASQLDQKAQSGIQYKVAYAVSKDGYEWSKPSLGLVNWEGSRDNNILPWGTNWMRRANVIKDLRDPDPKRRFKMTYVDVFDRKKAITKAYSKDGIDWELNGDGKPWFRKSHSGNLLGWDPRIEQFVFYVRMPGPQNSVGRSTSRDFITWSKPEQVIVPDRKEPNLHFKGLAAFLYENLYLAWLWVFEKGEEGYVRAGAELAISRDGIRWKRPFSGTFIMDKGEPGTWDSKLSIPVAPVVHDHRIWVYYWGENMPYSLDSLRKVTDGWIKNGKRIQRATGLATLRVDRFVSLRARDRGEVTTKLLKTAGGQLVINAQVRGELRAEILDEDGHPLPRYSIQNCRPIQGDSLHHVLAWRETSILPSACKAGIRIRFLMRDTDLYAFQVMSQTQL